jgi:hypothetical protein
VTLAPGSDGPGAPCFVWLNILDLDQRYLLGTLRRVTCEQLETDLSIDAFSTFSLSITGAGPVYFSGAARIANAMNLIILVCSLFRLVFSFLFFFAFFLFFVFLSIFFIDSRSRLLQPAGPHL